MTKIIGHRGGRSVWAENSLTGFRQVRELGVDGVEFDVHLTAWGELLVIHDATLDRTTFGAGPVADLPRGAHASTTLKGTSEGIPTLSSVLDVFAGSDIELHVELKDDANGVPYPGLGSAVVAEVVRRGLLGQSFLTSFSVPVLEQVRTLRPRAKTLNSMHGPVVVQEGLLGALERRLAVADVIAIHNEVLARDWDEITARVPLDRLGGWVSNSDAELRFWLDRGMRQITTDDPIRAIQLRNNGARL